MLDLWTPKRVAEELGVTRQTVNIWIHSNKFPNVQRVSGNFIIPATDIENFIQLRIKELENESVNISAMIDKLKTIVV